MMRRPQVGAAPITVDAPPSTNPVVIRRRKQRARAPISERATLTVEETAQYLGIGRQTAYDEARNGGLPIIRLGRSKKRIVVVRALLDEMIIRRGREAWGQPTDEPTALLVSDQPNKRIRQPQFE